MLDLETVKKDIESWIVNFVEVPHPNLGGWAPCPYARKARLDRDFEVLIGNDLGGDLQLLGKNGITKSVVIVVYDAGQYTGTQFESVVQDLNSQYLVRRDLLALSDHPGHPEVVNGVCMNQGKYAMALVQKLSDLDDKAKLVAKKGFYHNWPEGYLQDLFLHRQDPRK